MFPECENQPGHRHLQVEIYDYNVMPSIKYTWNQLTGECGEPLDGPGYTENFEYDANISGGLVLANGTTYDRLVLDLFMCAPWGDYELIVEAASTNGETNGVPNAMNPFAFQVENGPDEFHIWDSVNTPHRFNNDYAPIPPGGGESQTYRWPLEGSEGYYSLMYSGPMPPLQCPNLQPAGISYVGCFEAGIYGRAPNPTGSENFRDAAELLRMFDGIDDGGIDANPQIMTLEKCRDNCSGYQYFGLESGVKCFCSNESPPGEPIENCGFPDDEWVWEYRWLCSGESRVQCGTRLAISVYEITDETVTDESTPSPVASVDATLTPVTDAITPSPVASGETCQGDIPGIPSGDGTVCCDSACGQCGGSGCFHFSGGPGNCCIGGSKGILENADLCSSTGTAPCRIDGDGPPSIPAPSPEESGPSAETCPGDIPGIASGDGTACCDSACGKCGGFMCQALPGGPGKCCIGGLKGILENADPCSSTGAAPCRIDA